MARSINGRSGEPSTKGRAASARLRVGVEHEEVNVVVVLAAGLADVLAMLADEELVQLEILADNGFADSGHG